ncbi:MAG: aspartate-semialdehyde dehydrogenase [Terracidiphilus sp.]|jgi:aspartate-semialdehyde dehydrogenase
MNTKYPIGILGATGMVGQRYIQLLGNHPWFEIVWLAASDRSSGKPYGEAAKWRLDTPLPDRIAGMTVAPADPEGAPKIVFASVDAAIARELEPKFAAAGCAVISNSSAFRMAPNVPLVIPEVNAYHLHLIDAQPSRAESGGYIVTNPNCSTIGLVMALKPIEERFGIEQIFVSTMQAVSGAGYPGVASMDILGNVVPYIGSEEEKMEAETLKLLGKLKGQEVAPLAARITAHCNRVAVEDGHTECVSIKLGKPASREEILAAWADFRPLAGKQLPTAPDQPIQWAPQNDRPQPRLDRNRDHGMAVTVGRLRPCGLLDWKFVVLSHNTVRGAAGATILNAELLASLGKLEPLEAAPPDRSGALQRKRTMELVDDIVGGAMGLVGGLGMV